LDAALATISAPIGEKIAASRDDFRLYQAMRIDYIIPDTNNQNVKK